MESLEQQLLVLASLLHDIGKFGQRADAPLSEGLEHVYCPNGESHKHVLYTDYFIEHELRLPEELQGKRSALARLASVHHRADPDNRAEMCLQEGDRLSSGHDRLEGSSEGNYKSARLESIFSQVHLRPGTGEQTPLLRYRLAPLDGEDGAIFPTQTEKAKATTYPALYEAFLKAMGKVPLDMGLDHYLPSVQTVLERFTWCIPSSTYGTRADISLYDHCYTTAAIAQALYVGNQPAAKLRETPLLLVAGELSGIQNFIFGRGEQGDRGASKLLRARSFSVQMLTRSIWLRILTECGLSSVARIMDAGGRFILLLPDTGEVREKLQKIEREAVQYVLEAFNGILRVTFARQPLKAVELGIEHFSSIFKALNDKIEREKLRPFAALLQEGLSPILALPSSLYAQYGTCPFCGLRPAQGLEDEEAACSICQGLIQQVGRRLPDARYAVFSSTGAGFPLFGGVHLRLEEERPTRADRAALDILSLKDREAFSAAPVAGYVPRIGSADIADWDKTRRVRPPEGERWETGQPKTFDVLAQEARIQTEEGFRSIACLAACKADVDNLGLLFGIGLEEGGESRFSLSRFAMLSRMMHHFFSSFLIAEITRKYPNIYVVFAGGDDLFVLGPWSDIILFAEMLQNLFARFTGHNAEVTLSAGIALAKSGVPMRVIRDLAEEQLEASKGRRGLTGDTAEKNAISLFGITCSWTEFSPKLEQGEWLEELCLSHGITQGFVRRLLGYSREARAFAGGDVASGLYRSHMMYDMERNCDKKKLSPDDLKRIRGLCHDKGFEQMEISITWALYRTRMS